MQTREQEPVVAVPERMVKALPGWIGLVTVLLLIGLSIWLFALGLPDAPWLRPSPVLLAASAVLFLVACICCNGLFVVQPNQARVLVLFGRYTGTVKADGWYFVNPLVSKRPVSLRVRNFTSPQLKVNDANGNPIEIAAVVVWRVVDTAGRCSSVEDYNAFVEVQSETAIRHLASQYPYDDGLNEGELSLRGSAEEVALALKKELQDRLEMAGIAVIEARISHLAYAPKSPAPCCSGSRPRPSSRPGRRLSRARSPWWRWPSTCWTSTGRWSSRRSGRLSWWQTCWSSSPATAPPRRPCRWRASGARRPALTGPH